MRRRTRRILQVGAAVVAAGLGVGGFFVVVPHTTIQSAKLYDFVVPHPALPRLAASPSSFTAVLLSHDPLPGVVAAAASDPAHTGAFSIEWFANGRNGTSLDIYVELLPTAALTHEVFTSDVKAGLSTEGLKKNNYTLRSRIVLPGIPGGVAASYMINHVAPTTTPAGSPPPLPPTPAITVIFSKGHLVFALQASSYHLNQDQVVALAYEEYALVDAVLPNFHSLRVTDDPLVATILWSSISFLLFALVAGGPWIMERNETERRRREELRARAAVRSRGSKVARRRATSR